MSFLLLSGGKLQAQNFQETFGQNRIQFHPFDWSFYETEHFKIYFYPGGQDIGKYVIYAAEKNLKQINDRLGIKYRSKISLIVFNDISDANQTNIGSDNLLTNAALGNIKFIENKLFIYYTGRHEDLDRQIRRGLMQSLLERSGLGASYDNMLKTFFITDVPAWYSEGMKSYMAVDWNYELDNQLKEKMIRAAYKDEKKIYREDQVLLGHSILHYIEWKYGPETIKNLFFYCRRTKNLETALFYVLNKTQQDVLVEWYDYYRELFNLDTKAFTNATSANYPLKTRKKFEYYNFKYSPNQRYMAYVKNEMGKYKVVLVDLYTNESKVVFRGGFKTQRLLIDHNYPLIDFSPKDESLVIIDEKRDQMRLTNYFIADKKYEYRNLEKFQRIYSFSFAGSKKMIVLSAAQKGNTDIYLMNIASQSVTRITNDYFDDLNPAFYATDSTEQIIFQSNRFKDSVKAENFQQQPGQMFFDLYRYDLKKESEQLLGSICKTPMADEGAVTYLNEKEYLYRSEISGIGNIYYGKMNYEFIKNMLKISYLDSNRVAGTKLVSEDFNVEEWMYQNKATVKNKEVVPVYQWVGKEMANSDYHLSIQEYDLGKDSILMVQWRNNKPNVFFISLDSLKQGGLNNQVTQYRSLVESKNKITRGVEKVVADTVTKPPIKIENKYQTEFDYLSDTNLFKESAVKLEQLNRLRYSMSKMETLDEMDSANMFRYSKIKPYRTRFYVDNTNIQFNNNFLIDRYQKFPNSNVIPPFGPTFTLGIKDLFENYRIYGGMRIYLVPFLSGNEFFISYENRKKRLDKRYTFYRKANTFDISDDATGRKYTLKEINNYFDIGLSYPFDYTKSIRFNVGFKMNETTFKSTNIESALARSINENWFILRTEYVFDNTIIKQLNIPNGTKYKFFAEFYKEVPTDSITIGSSLVIPVPKFNEGYFVNIGFDFRTYTPIVKNLIWANRISGATSMGTRKMLYQLGGIDNEIFPKYNNEVQLTQQADYAFQMNVFNLRGFSQNSRNGNNVLVYNTELRVPIFSLLSARPIKNSLTRDFMFLVFTDVGMAWSGVNPYSRENPNYVKTLRNDISEIKGYYLRNPMVASFGLGARIPLFTGSPFMGYYLKIDMGWRFDSGKLSSTPGFNFSLTGIDF